MFRMKVRDIMTKEVIFVDKDVSLGQVLKLMKKYSITKIPVLENKRLIGVVTDNIIATKLGSIRKKWVSPSRLHASSVMDRKFEIVDPETDVKTIIETVGEPGPTMLNVVENDKLIGVVTKADLLPFVTSNRKIEEIMSKNVYSVSPDDRVIHARRIMIDQDIARLPVIDEGKLIGVISDNEIAFALAGIKESFSLGKQKRRLDELLVRDAMRSPAICTTKDVTCREAANVMIKNNIGFLPVIENEKIIGVVTRTDLIKTMIL